MVFNVVELGTIIQIRMPGVSRTNGITGEVDFRTEGNDWVLFDDVAQWKESLSMISFRLRDGKDLEAMMEVTFVTLPGEFRLPLEFPDNNPEFQVEARSADGVDEIIPRTSVMQSDRVPRVLNYTNSTLTYDDPYPSSLTEVNFEWMTNRPLYPGKILYLRLPGFTSTISELELSGPDALSFYAERAFLNIPNNEVQLIVNKTLYTNEVPGKVTFSGLSLPPSLYEDDPSILVWNNDPFADDPDRKQSVLSSPRVGADKTFIRSELQYVPNLPGEIADVTVILQPSILFYQHDQIVFHLHGFRCELAEIPLEGPSAEKFGHVAYWNYQDYTLKFVVASQKVLPNDAPTEVLIRKSSAFRLPNRLSENDGILTVEGVGALIRKEKIKTSPRIGEKKEITDSSCVFLPALSEQITKIRINFVANSDILPSSYIYFKLAGLTRTMPNEDDSQDGLISLSGVNAPLFTASTGEWSQSLSELKMQVVAEAGIVAAGRKIQFFIEDDMMFTLPYAMYDTDESLFIRIPEAGIDKAEFKYSSRVGRVAKTFPYSQLTYGDAGSMPYPLQLTDVTFQFQPNIMLTEGAVVRLTLPGFSCPGMSYGDVQQGQVIAITNLTSGEVFYNGFVDSVPLGQVAPFIRMTWSAAYPGPDGPNSIVVDWSSRNQEWSMGGANGHKFRVGNQTVPIRQPSTAQYDSTYKRFTYTLKGSGPSHHATWDEFNQLMDFEVAATKRILRTDLIKVRVPFPNCRLPQRLAKNDETLRVSSVKGQMIRHEPIKSSPRVVNRTFDISRFEYTPRDKQSFFLFKIEIMATVDIVSSTPIILHLPAFDNILGNELIHLTGTHANRISYYNSITDSIMQSTAQWNQTTFQLKLTPGLETPLEEFTLYSFLIEESQGFNLPRSLLASDPNLQIESGDSNIRLEPVKESPMVGDGPENNQWFCMFQYESGTRTINSANCNPTDCEELPAMLDPCSSRELERCKCSKLRHDGPTGLVIRGFQLSPLDELIFRPYEEECRNDDDLESVDTFVFPAVPEVSSDNSELIWNEVRSTATGYFRICVRHRDRNFTQVFDVGKVSVRPMCTDDNGDFAVDKVMVEGHCAKDCPASKIPVAGECVQDPVAEWPVDQQPVLVSVRMDNPSALSGKIHELPSNDTERAYFERRFCSELAHFLNTDSSRFQITSVTKRHRADSWSAASLLLMTDGSLRSNYGFTLGDNVREELYSWDYIEDNIWKWDKPSEGGLSGVTCPEKYVYSTRGDGTWQNLVAPLVCDERGSRQCFYCERDTDCTGFDTYCNLETAPPSCAPNTPNPKLYQTYRDTRIAVACQYHFQQWFAMPLYHFDQYSKCQINFLTSNTILFLM